MSKNLDFSKLLERVLKFISIRPRSQKEIIDYLQKKVPQKKDLQEKILKEIENLGLVDDQAFACWWVEQRNTFRPKGKKALFYELRQKGVDNLIIEEILAKGLDELSLAYQLSQKRWPSFQKLPPQIAREKLAGFLLRRGFNWEIISKTLDKITKKQ